MEKLPANTGWHWIKQGFGLFRKQPGALSALFVSYMFFMLIIGILPVLGQVLPVIMVPVFSMAFMQACLHIERSKAVFPTLLLTGFRKPVFPKLFGLGLLYLLVATIAVGASALVDGGIFWQLITGQIDGQSELIGDSNMGGAMLLAIAIYIPAAMAFCFAAPLIGWQKLSIGKAIFFSFFAVLRSAKAFVVFACAWFALSVVGSQIVMLLFGRSETAMMVMLPLSAMLTLVMHCSFYASYRQIFGAPQDPANKDEANKDDKPSLDKPEL
ncbi:MAG: hypothetical protein ACI83P_000755 [Janthinobacterium sp.]|jgi:hypothetical protein